MILPQEASGYLIPSPRKPRVASVMMMPLSISYDHRWIDGADAARFLRWLAEGLEQPMMLLIDE